MVDTTTAIRTGHALAPQNRILSQQTSPTLISTLRDTRSAPANTSPLFYPAHIAMQGIASVSPLFVYSSNVYVVVSMELMMFVNLTNPF